MIDYYYYIDLCYKINSLNSLLFKFNLKHLENILNYYIKNNYCFNLKNL
jgi:hypothetical protein